MSFWKGEGFKMELSILFKSQNDVILGVWPWISQELISFAFYCLWYLIQKLNLVRVELMKRFIAANCKLRWNMAASLRFYLIINFFSFCDALTHCLYFIIELTFPHVCYVAIASVSTYILKVYKCCLWIAGRTC